jgi:general secretion pathway protein L
MAEALIIRFPTDFADAKQAQWMLVDSQHHRMGAVVTGNLQEASALASNRKVYAIVNGSSVLHTEPVLPPIKGNTKLQQVVPFALEDQLATDVDDLHFAIGKRGSRSGTPVAVVAHEQIQNWIAELQGAGLHPVALMTDASTIPDDDQAITMVIEDGRVLLRRKDAPPVILDISPLDETLQLLIPEATEVAVHIYVPEVEYEQHQHSIESLRARAPNVEVRLLPEGALPLFATRVTHSDSLNLLQGVYEPKRDYSSQLAPWRMAAMFIGALFVLHLLVTGTHWWQLKRQEAKLDQQISEVFAQGMPGVAPPNPAQARSMFESRLAALQTGSVDSQLLHALDAMADAIGKTPDSQVQDISYQDNGVKLRVLTGSVDSLDQICKVLNSHGLIADIESAVPRDSRTEGRLKIKNSNSH